MKTSKSFFTFGILAALLGLGSKATSAYLDGDRRVDALIVPDELGDTTDLHLTLSATEGVVYRAAGQTCTDRMGCSCKHRRSDTDTMKIHRPDDDATDSQDQWQAHLDIRCTKCNNRYYCPKTNSFRD